MPSRTAIVAVMTLSACVTLAPAHADQAADVAQAMTPQSLLLASDAQSGAQFGAAIALDGDTALIAAPAVGGTGAAYVFVRSGGAWSEQAKLVGGSTDPNAFFGTSVAVSGDIAFVGAPGEDGIIGAVYVFRRIGTAWSQVARLIAPDRRAGDFFGRSLSVQGDTLLVSASRPPTGVVSVFVGAGANWSHQATLTPSDGASRAFGASVAVYGDLAVVGSPRDDIGANVYQGSVYVFGRSGTSWTEQQKLTAGNPLALAQFGTSVALQGATILVGAPGQLTSPPGAAYAFVSSGGSWTQQARLTPTDVRPVRDFGASVGIHGDRALVSGRFLNPDLVPLPCFGTDCSGYSQPVAYTFGRSGSAWAQTDRLTRLGSATQPFQAALGLDTLLLGSPSYATPETERLAGRTQPGAAFVYADGPDSPTPSLLEWRLTSLESGGGFLAFGWRPPTSGAPPASYVIQAGSSAAASDLAQLDTQSAATGLRVFAPPGQYFVRVRPRVGGVVGQPSNEAVVTVGAACSAPAPPGNLTSAVTGTTVSLNWQSASGATSYIVEAGSGTGLADLATLNNGAATTLVTAAPPGTYYVRVRAANSCGSGPASNEVVLTVVGATAPGAPTLNPAVVTGSTVALSWTAGGGGAPTSFTLTAAATSTGAPIATVTLTGTGASFADVPSGTYFLRLTASNAAGTSAPSPQVIVTVP